MRLVILTAAILAACAGAASTAQAAEPKRTYRYDVPVDASSPWPSMRRDRRNTANSPVRARYRRGERPWAFRSGKGIFSTPVVGGDGTVYAGSADTWFYAVGPRGKLRWRFETGEIIDSAATLGRYDRRRRTSPVTFGSGDEYLYRLRSDRRRMSQRARTLWRFRATRKPATGQLVNWWEGNAVTGPGGVIFAGNTGGGAYAIEPTGRQRWVYQAGNSMWTAPAMGDDGTTYWGSVDLNVYALDRSGRKRWAFFTPGFVTSSPSLARDGTLYVGSFDGKLHALDSRTGAERWSYATSEHIYSSPALSRDERTVFIASADGSVYALDRGGRLRWRYDTGDAVRSSPVVGRTASGRGEILYVGSSNGTLYALDARTGRRRWSFDTTPRDPLLRDRNDLNGSPALGENGVYIGGEHGRLWYVPYDYCLHRRDSRCSRNPGEAFADELTRVLQVTPGGNTESAGARPRRAAATVLSGRLVVRRRGETLDAALQPQPLINASPPFEFSARLSGDGHHVHVLPTGFLRPGTDYRVRIAGGWSAGASSTGQADSTLRFRTERSRGPLPLTVTRNRVSALVMSRLAIPLPTLLPSVNQIGFDSYDWIVGTLAKSPPDAGGEGSLLLWVVGSRKDGRGVRAADPRSSFAFPLAGRYKRDSFAVSQRGVPLTFSFGEVPLRRLDLRGQLTRSMSTLGAGLYGEVFCPEVPVYGGGLELLGLCNRDRILVSTGTFITRAYEGRGRANVRPQGLSVRGVRLERPSAMQAGAVSATFGLARGARYRARSHVVAVLLTDGATGAPLSLDVKKNTRVSADRRGNLTSVRLRLPAGTQLPQRITAYVVTDAFPLAVREL